MQTVPGSKTSPKGMPVKIKKSEFVEGLLGLAVIVAINLIWFRGNPGFIGVHPHPYWAVVLPLAARYGFRAGLWTGSLAGLALLAMQVLQQPQLNLLDLIQIRHLGYPLLFMIVGIIIGEIREIQKRRYDELQIGHAELQETYDHLHQRHELLQRAKQEIDTRIISQEHTLSTLYESAQALKSLQEKEIYPAVMKLLQDFIAAETGSIYMLEDNTLHLAGGFDNDNEPTHRAEVDPDEGLIGRAIAAGDTVAINMLIDIDEFSEYAAAGPLISAPLLTGDNKVLGVLNIDRLPFEKFSPQTIRMASMIADWCGAAIENSRTFKETKDKNISDDITEAYTYTYFNKRFQEEFSRARRYKILLSLLGLEIVDFNLFEERIKKDVLTVLSLVMQNKLRGVDLLFHDEDPGKYIMLLPNTPLKGAQVVQKGILKEIQAFAFKPYEDEEKLLQIRIGVAAITSDMEHPEQLKTLAEEDVLASV